jgi:hypothetical protein
MQQDHRCTPLSPPSPASAPLAARRLPRLRGRKCCGGPATCRTTQGDGWRRGAGLVLGRACLRMRLQPWRPGRRVARRGWHGGWRMEVRPPVPASRRAKRGQRPCNWSWGVGGEGMPAERPVPAASAARIGTRSAKSGQDPMKRETVRAARLPNWGRSPGREAQSAKSGQDPMKRETERAGRLPDWGRSPSRRDNPQNQDKTL